jgi:hypothetical protein
MVQSLETFLERSSRNLIWRHGYDEFFSISVIDDNGAAVELLPWPPMSSSWGVTRPVFGAVLILSAGRVRPRSSSCRRLAAAAAGHGMMKQLHEGDRMSAHMIMIIIAFFSIHHGGLAGRLIGAIDWCDWAFRLNWATRMSRNGLSDVRQLLVVVDGSV